MRFAIKLFVQGGSRLLYINASFSCLVEGKKRSYQSLNGLHFGTPIAHVKDGHSWVVERYKLMIRKHRSCRWGIFWNVKTSNYPALVHDAAVIVVLPH